MYRLYWAPKTAAFAPQAVLEEAGLPYQREILDIKAKRASKPAPPTWHSTGCSRAMERCEHV